MIRAQIPTPARRAATLLGVVLVLATIATLVARQYWFFELFSHFRWQYVTAAVLATPVLWLCGRRALAILCVAALGIHALALMQQRFATLERSTGTERQLRIVSFNVFHRNAEYAEALAEIERISPDIVCLYETTDAWRQHLAKLSARYAFALFTGNGPHSGVACLSRIVPLRVVPPDANARAAPWMQLELESGGTRFRVVGVHLGYPLGAAAMRARNRQLLELAQVLRRAGDRRRRFQPHALLALQRRFSASVRFDRL